MNSRHEFRFTGAMWIGGLLAFLSALGFATAWERRRKQAMRRQDDAMLVVWFFVMFLGIVAVNIAVAFAGCVLVLR